jgi:hypothetical protein
MMKAVKPPVVSLAWEKDAVADIDNDNNRTNESQPWVSHRRT